MRPLSFEQAVACEIGSSSRCRCRCGGKLHGAYRVDNPLALPLTDPHFPAAQMSIDNLMLPERSYLRRVPGEPYLPSPNKDNLT